MHVLKSDPILMDLEHMQVDGLGMAYLFYNRQGQQGLLHETTLAIQTHVMDTLPEWISHSAHLELTLLPLEEGRHHAVVALEWQRQGSWT